MSAIRRITIVTPCFNAARVVGETVRSIVGQRSVAGGRIELEYLVCDGGSTDGTVEAVEAASGGRAVVLSERDGGMYEALAKGLRRATGEVVGYLNAGDVYSPAALDVVADVFEATPARWITGMAVACNERLQVIEARLPYPYRRRLLRRGLYGRLMPFVQQESTFWRRELHATLDLERLAALRYAGDFYLWRRFAEVADLVVVEAYLGGFTFHRGQLSEDRAAYLREFDALRDPAGPFDWVQGRIDAALWSLPAPLKKRLRPEGLIRYDLEAERWR